jgi:RNA-binding protein
MDLTSKDRKKLKSLAHGLNPYVHAGKEGITDQLVAEVVRALNDHELIKVKISALDRDEFRSLAGEISERSGSALVDTVGRMAILFRESDNPERQGNLLGR